MSFMDILKQYTDPAPASASTSQAHFDEVAKAVPPDMLAHGVTETLRSEQTPPFGDMVGQLFGRSNPQQQAGVLNQILSSLGPTALSSLGGGTLGRVLGNMDSGSRAAPTLTPEQASQVTPDQVGQIAAHAEKQDPGIVDRIGGFYGQHPDLVRSLGGMALAVLLCKMANRR